jgi:hypothetical protein
MTYSQKDRLDHIQHILLPGLLRNRSNDRNRNRNGTAKMAGTCRNPEPEQYFQILIQHLFVFKKIKT